MAGLDEVQLRPEDDGDFDIVDASMVSTLSPCNSVPQRWRVSKRRDEALMVRGVHYLELPHYFVNACRQSTRAERSI